MNWFQIASTNMQIIFNALGIIIAILLYRLNRQNRYEGWNRTLRDFHQYFWNDADCKEVRSWLACDPAYEQIRELIAKRLQSPPVTEKEYEVLEKIDKFAALLIAYKGIQPNLSRKQRALQHRMFDDYWLNKCLTYKKRPEMRLYFDSFFDELCSNLENDGRDECYLNFNLSYKEHQL